MVLVYLRDVDAVAARVVAAGVRFYVEPREKWRDWGDRLGGQREFLVQDPDGYLVMVVQRIGERPLPSLLRGFSAPVLLDDGLDDAALLVLLQHDADAFNRWEAGQRLAVQRLLAAVRQGGDLVLDEAFVSALRTVLTDPALDPPVKAFVCWSSNPASIAPDQERVLAGLAREDLFVVVLEQLALMLHQIQLLEMVEMVQLHQFQDHL